MTPASSRGIDHVGLTVPDIDAATRFLRDAIGAEPLYDVQELSAPPLAGREAERELGIPSGAAVVQMRLLRVGVGPSLELFQLAHVSPRSSSSLQDYGLQHVAVYVDDVQAAAERFVRAGGRLLSEPHALSGVESGEHNTWVYGRAPWGSLFELISYPDGVRLPPGSPPRWTPPTDTKPAS